MNKPLLSSRASLLNKKGVRIQQYGTPTAINPLLPAPSPQQQEIDEEQEIAQKQAAQPKAVAAWEKTFAVRQGKNKKAVIPPEIPGQGATSNPLPMPAQPAAPGQPGNPPGNPPQNGPQNLKQTPSIEQKPFGKTLPQNDPRMSNPAQQPGAPPTSGKGSWVWMTSSKKRAKLLNKKWDSLRDNSAVVSSKMTRPPKGIYPGEFSFGKNRNVRYEATGEYRPPRRGEYYLSGATKVSKESLARKKANDELAVLSRKYHKTTPVQAIKNVLSKYGFQTKVLDGIYVGNNGEMRERCGPRTHIAIRQRKLAGTRLWQVMAYLS